MKLIFTWKEIIVQNGSTEITRFPATCNVRNEVNKRRSQDEVIFTIPQNGHPKPYYPRTFPSGIFSITDIENTTNPEYAPVKIKTTAKREVFTWDLDRDGNYWKPNGLTQIDTAYWLHYTDSRTTLGCIRIGSAKDAISLANIIAPVLRDKEPVWLEVL